VNGHLFGDPMTSTEITIPFSIASSWAYTSSQGRASLRPNHTVLHMYSVGTLCGTSISNYSASVDLEKSTGRRRPPSVDRLAFCFVRQFCSTVRVRRCLNWRAAARPPPPWPVSHS
jgi:hypothetical protein